MDVQADRDVPLLFTYGINRFSHDMAHMPLDVPLCLMLPLVPYIVFANIKGSGCAGSHEPSVFAM